MINHKILYIFCLMALCGLNVPCKAEATNKIKRLPLTNHLYLNIPSNYTSEWKKSSLDFEILYLKKNGKVCMGVYLGNQPDFHPDKNKGIIISQTINGIPCETLIVKADGLLIRETLFRLTEKSEWPQRLHCWYSKLSEADAVESDEIIKSIQFALNERKVGKR